MVLEDVFGPEMHAFHDILMRFGSRKAFSEHFTCRFMAEPSGSCLELAWCTSVLSIFSVWGQKSRLFGSFGPKNSGFGS